VGVTTAGIALPRRRVPAKRLEEARAGGAFEALRVPWFDEDALTLALDAGLALDEAVDRAERVVLALGEEHDQPGLVGHALDLDAPVAPRTGPLAGLDALADAGEGSTLVLAGGAGAGGAGAAVLVEPGEGAPVEAVGRATGRPLGDETGGLLASAVDAVGAGGARVPADRPGRGAVAEGEPATATVGEAGSAAGLVELVEALDGDGPASVADVAGSRAVAVRVADGTVDVARAPGEPADVTVEAWRELGAEVEPWHGASQGAYVSREDYEADPAERYGARRLGEGTVAAATTIRGGPPGEFRRQHEAAGPYDVVVVDDGDTRRIHQSTAPPGELAIGDPVDRVLRRLFRQEGAWRYAAKVRPV